MQRIKIVGACLVAMFAISAMGSAAIAQAGEVGICGKAAKVGKHYTGKYTGPTCVTEEPKGEGKYEWSSPSGVTFTGKGKTSVLEGEAGDVTCKSVEINGEWFNTRTGKHYATFKECVLSVTKEPCQNGAEKGTITTLAVDGTLIDHGEKGPGGGEPAPGEIWQDFIGPEEKLSEFECGGIPFATSGSFAAVMTPVDAKPSTKFTASFGRGKAEQLLLTTFFNPFTSKLETGPSTLSTVITAKSSKKIEFRA